MVSVTPRSIIAVVILCYLLSILRRRHTVEGYTSQNDINSIARKAVDSILKDPALRQTTMRSVQRVTLSKPRLINRKGKVAKSEKDGIRKKFAGLGAYVAKYQAQARFVLPAVRSKGEVDDIIQTHFFYITGEGSSIAKAKSNADMLLQKTRASIQEQARLSGLMSQ